MAFYWRLHDIPELRPLDRGQQQEVWAATAGRRLRDPSSLLAIVVCTAAVGLCYTLGSYFIPLSYGGVIGGGIGAGVGSFLGLEISMLRSRPYLAEEIRRRSW